MILIRDIVLNALETGYLSKEAQEQIQQVISIYCESEDLEALIQLQKALNAGKVRQELPNKTLEISLKKFIGL